MRFSARIRAARFEHGDSFFISVASVDAQGHESLFAFPEMRCTATSRLP